MGRGLNRRLFILNLLVLSFACTSVELSTRFGWLDRFEWIYYDAWHQLSGHRYDPKHVLIVTLDDASLLAHQDEPLVFWGPYFAQAIETLRKAGARLIGLDFVFTASSESWLNKMGLTENDLSRTYDIAMRTQLASGQAVLAGSQILNEEGGRELLLPINMDFHSDLLGTSTNLCPAQI